MGDGYIITRWSHGNEPLFIGLGIASRFNDDIVIPAPKSRIGIINEIAEGKGIDKARLYIDENAFNLSSGYGVIWGVGMDYGQWISNNIRNMHRMDEELSRHYRRFKAVNLDGDEKEFVGTNAKMVINAGDIYDNLRLDAPVVYAFPHRYSEIIGRVKGMRPFGDFLKRRESGRSANFIPRIHSLEYDKNYEPLGNEEFTPHMKEPPVRFDIAIPDNSIGMVFSGTGKQIGKLKQIAEHTNHGIVTGVFSPVEGGKFVKITPPRAEFVHVYADPRVRAVVGRIGYGMLWSAWNAGKPVVYPAWEQGDDEELVHNIKTVKKRGLGIEIKDPAVIDDAVEKAQACVPSIAAMNAELEKKFGTLDGPAYIAKRIMELGLY